MLARLGPGAGFSSRLSCLGAFDGYAYAAANPPPRLAGCLRLWILVLNVSLLCGSCLNNCCLTFEWNRGSSSCAIVWWYQRCQNYIMAQLVPGAEYNSCAHLQLRRVRCGEVLAVQGLCILKHEAYLPTFKLTKLQSCGKLRQNQDVQSWHLNWSGTSSTALRLALWCWLLHMLLEQFLGDSSILPSPSVLTLLVLVSTSTESQEEKPSEAIRSRSQGAGFGKSLIYAVFQLFMTQVTFDLVCQEVHMSKRTIVVVGFWPYVAA